MSQANFTPENVSDDEPSRGFRAKTRNNFNFIQIAINGLQSWVQKALDEIKASIIKPALRGGFAVNDIRYFGTLPTAVGAIPSSSSQTVYVTASLNISADLTVPTNVSVVVVKGGSFAIASGKILTFNGSFDSQGNALSDIFSGSGSYRFGKAVRLVGAGSPESVVYAPVGSEYLRNDGGSSTTLYIKESGTGNTGWAVPGSGGLSGSGSSGRVAYWSSASTLTSTADFLFTDSSGAGVSTVFSVKNGDNTNAASHALLDLVTGGASGGDPYLRWTIGSTFFSFGMDNSVSDRLILTGASAVGFGGGALDFMSFDAANSRIGIRTNDPQYPLDFVGSSVMAVLAIRNPGTGSGNHSQLYLETCEGTVDPFIHMFAGFASTTVGTRYCFGIDSSVSGRPFRLESGGQTLGAGTTLVNVTAAGALSILAGNFDVTRSASGSAVSATVENASNTAGSDSTMRIKVAGSSSGDPKMVLQSGSTVIGIGMDVSDSFKLKVDTSETIGSGSPLMTWDMGNQRVGILQYATSPATALHMLENSTSSIEARFEQMSNTGTPGCQVSIISNSGSPSLRILQGAAATGRDWMLGVNVAVSNDLRLVSGVSNFASGGTVVFTISTAGIVTLLNATDASAVGAAALVLSGGLGVAKKLYLGDDLYLASGKVYRVNGTQVLTAQQTGMGTSLSSSTAGGTYGATEQTMLQEAHNKIRLLEAKLKTHGLIAD